MPGGARAAEPRSGPAALRSSPALSPLGPASLTRQLRLLPEPLPFPNYGVLPGALPGLGAAPAPQLPGRLRGKAEGSGPSRRLRDALSQGRGRGSSWVRASVLPKEEKKKKGGGGKTGKEKQREWEGKEKGKRKELEMELSRVQAPAWQARNPESDS